MKKIKVLLLTASLLATLSSIGCATTRAAEDSCRRTVGMSIPEATAIVAAFEGAQSAGEATKPVTSADEALAALKSDRLDAFAAAVAWTAADASPKARVVKAQLLIAWGEAELTVGEVLAETAAVLDAASRESTVAGAEGNAAAQARIADYRRTDEALRILAAEHVAQGFAEAKRLMLEFPDDYHGFRVAADAHRMRGELREFSDLVRKIEAWRPDSNGLVFLRGVERYAVDGDISGAAEQFRQALQNDPLFVRSQVQLVLIAPTLAQRFAEYEALKKIAPHHQIVRWAGPGIEAAHAAMTQRQQMASTIAASRTTRGVLPEAVQAR